ncbi:MAG: emrA 1 [Verrucomicrobiales bacterium]|nr:emrA 1 [Verrucomicrobiales bacterium]
MNDHTTTSVESPAAPPKPKPSSGGATRIVVIAIVSLLTLAALGVGVPWGFYRYKHIVVSEAAVKGTITKLGARIDGRIKNIEVQPGQVISKGEVLLRMEDHHLQAALDRARAELRSAAQDLDSEKKGIVQTRKRLTADIERVNGTRKKIAAELEAQKSILSRTQKQFDRMTSLAKSGAASLADQDTALSDRDKAQAYVNGAMGSLEAADFNYQKAMIDLEGLAVRESRLGVLESQMEVAKAKIAQAEADLEATVIKAPEDGRVLERMVEVGGSAKVGEPMLSLWIGKPWVEAWVDERDLRKFAVGTPVDVSLDAEPDQKLPGKVIAVGLESDKQFQPTPVPATLHSFLRQNAMVPVRIALDESHNGIQLGLSAVVGIRKISEKPDTAVVKQELPEVGQDAQKLTKVTHKP